MSIFIFLVKSKISIFVISYFFIIFFFFTIHFSGLCFLYDIFSFILILVEFAGHRYTRRGGKGTPLILLYNGCKGDKTLVMCLSYVEEKEKRKKKKIVSINVMSTKMLNFRFIRPSSMILKYSVGNVVFISFIIEIK